MAVLNEIVMNTPPDLSEEITGYRVGIFPSGGQSDVPLATKDYPASAATSPEVGKLALDLTAWGNENPVPEGTYSFKLKSLGHEGQESPWGNPTSDFGLTNLTPPGAVQVS